MKRTLKLLVLAAATAAMAASMQVLAAGQAEVAAQRPAFLQQPQPLSSSAHAAEQQQALQRHQQLLSRLSAHTLATPVPHPSTHAHTLGAGSASAELQAHGLYPPSYRFSLDALGHMFDIKLEKNDKVVSEEYKYIESVQHTSHTHTASSTTTTAQQPPARGGDTNQAAVIRIATSANTTRTTQIVSASTRDARGMSGACERGSVDAQSSSELRAAIRVDPCSR